MMRVDSMQAQGIKTKGESGEGSLGGKSPVPKRHTDPVAEFRSAVRLRNVQSDRAAEFARGRDGDRVGDRIACAELLAGLGNKAPGIVFRVGMRNVQSGRGDFF